MGSEEAPLSRPSTSRHRRRLPGDDPDEASSLKRQKRTPHHRDHHRHGHGHRDRGNREEASQMSAAKPGEGEAEDGEILDDASAAAAARGPDAGFGKAGLVFDGLAPAPEYDDKSDANVLHASRLASDPSEKNDVSANKRKSDHAAHEPENGTICSSDRKYSKHKEPVERMSRFPQSISEREIEHKDPVVNDTEARSRLGHLVSRKDINGMQNVGDERHARSKVSQIEDHSMRYPYSRKHSETYHMNCLRSSHAYRESSSEAHSLRNLARDASEHENGGRCIEMGRYSTSRWVTGRGSYKERERSSMDMDRRSSSTRHKDNDGRRKDKSNGTCEVTDTVGDIRGMEKLSAGREMRYFRAEKMDARRTGELNGEYEHNDSTRGNYVFSNNSKEMPMSGEKCRERDLRKSRMDLARRKIKITSNTLQSKKKMILKRLRRKQER